MLVLLLWNAQRLMQQALDERVDEERRAFAPLVAAAAAPLLATRDYATVGELVQTSATSGAFEFIEVYDARGRLLARTGSQPAAGRAVVDQAVVLAGQPLGRVRFDLRTEGLADARARLRRDSLAIGAVVLAAGLALMGVGMVWLGRGLRELRAASRRVAAGDTAARVPPSPARELDDVARGFNRMAEAVQSQLAALQDSERFLRGVLDTLSEGYLIVDRDNRVIDCNETFLRLHGMTEKPVGVVDPGRAGTRLLRPDGSEVPPDQRLTRQVLASGQPQRDVVLQLQRADGSVSWIRVNASPLGRGDDGRPNAALSAMTDITRHVEAEQLLRDDNERLEQRVRRRTAELERAKDEAERASHAKSEFLSRMSHELRTPLNAILGFAQLLALDAGRLGDADRERLRQIEQAGWHLLAMINDVLDLARIEAGAMSTSPEPVELGALVEETLPLVQSQAAARGVRLVAPRAEPGGAWVRADRRRLKQVLSNLASNAVKYNRERGHVVLRLLPPQGGRRVLEVEDSGRGFTAEQLAQLYQPFTRFVRDDEVQEGTGIGLVITRRLLELMGGRLDVRSEPGVGSVFSIELPASDPPAPPAVALATPPPVSAAALGERRLLYVEDNPSNVELMRQVVGLRPAWRLEVAVDGPSGLARAMAGGLHAAVIDIDLPCFDGIELCRRLKAADATRALPLVALSANAMPADIRRAMGAGFDAYLTKPIDLPSMLARLDALLARGEEPR